MLHKIIYDPIESNEGDDSEYDSDSDTDTEYEPLPPRKIIGEWKTVDKVPYQVYLDKLKPKERQKKIDKDRYNTFLVFHSGKVIMSSMCADFSRETYYEFIKIIEENNDLFIEKLVR